MPEAATLPHNGGIPGTKKIRTAVTRAQPSGDARLRQLIRVLSENATVVVSGTKMAKELGVSHSAGWRLVQQLRGYGVDIEGHPTTGYVLKKVPDLPLPEILDPLLAGTTFSGKVHHSFRTASTNLDAMEAAAKGAPEGSVFLAEEQTAGRGRGGHTWRSEKSHSTYCSVVLRPSVPPAETLVLSLAAGLAARSAIEQVSGLHIDLRWPNDLLLNGKKCGGVLIEMTAEPTRVRHVVVGIGINVNQCEFADELRETATSLRMASGAASIWPRVALVAALLQSLDREYRALLPAYQVIRRFTQSSSYARGKQVRVEEQGGYEGVTAGLDERGFLLVRTADGMRTVISGGVRAIESD